MDLVFRYEHLQAFAIVPKTEFQQARLQLEGNCDFLGVEKFIKNTIDSSAFTESKNGLF